MARGEASHHACLASLSLCLSVLLFFSLSRSFSPSLSLSFSLSLSHTVRSHSGNTTLCRIAGVTSHGVVSPDSLSLSLSLSHSLSLSLLTLEWDGCAGLQERVTELEAIVAKLQKQ